MQEVKTGDSEKKTEEKNRSIGSSGITDGGTLLAFSCRDTSSGKQADRDCTGGADALHTNLEKLNQALEAMDLSGSSNLDMAPAQEAAKALAADAQALGTALQNIQTLTENLKTFAGQAAAYKESVDSSTASADAYLQNLAGTDLSDLESGIQTIAGDAAADAVRSALIDSGLSEEEIENAAASARAAAEAGADPDGIISEKQNQIHEEAEQARIALSGIVQLEIPQIQAETGDAAGIASDMQKQLEILSGAAEGMSGAGDQFEQLQNALAELKTGVAGLTQGSKSLSTGVAAYTGAVSQISEGVNALCEGSGALASGGQAMTEGYSSMLSGIGELADGLKEFDQEAAGELEKNAGDELKDLIAKIKGLRSADLSYNNFGGLAEGRTGSVRFIIETDEIR